MKIITMLVVTILITAGISSAQNKLTGSAIKYDSLLAKKLGADEYGMKSYVMAFLKAGPVIITDKVKRAKLQSEHLKNIMRLSEEGSLILAGPFMDDMDLRGIFIFNVASVEEARKIAETDPAVKAGTLTLELHPWYGSAALTEIPQLHKRIEKKSVDD